MSYKNYRIMKLSKLNFALITMTLLFVSISCDDNIEQPANTENIIPEKFTVGVPTALISTASNGRTSRRTADGDVNGNEIYEALGAFIHIGEESAKIVEAIMGGISSLGITGPITFSYESDDDERVKNMIVIENSLFEGVQYEFELTITDADSEGNADGGKAMQIFWNRSPVKGVAILKPFNIDRKKDINSADAIYRIDYSEAGEFDYDSHMIVSIAELTLTNPLEDPYSVDNLKMFVGKKGDFIDVYGNSNHPNAAFFTPDAGFSWSFVASGVENSDIGVAEVGLPLNTLDETHRSVLLEDYAIKKVFTDQINIAFPDLEQNLIDLYLFNTEAPGFFDGNGFVQGGTSPGTEYDPLVSRIQDLTPFNPSDIRTLEVNFK
jgi:hypothetical protein